MTYILAFVLSTIGVYTIVGLIGCAAGNCTKASNPYLHILYGAVMRTHTGSSLLRFALGRLPVAKRRPAYVPVESPEERGNYTRDD
ncbi:MAG: hypothetical protein AB7D36_07795 [Oscillospiraceae bacterium]